MLDRGSAAKRSLVLLQLVLLAGCSDPSTPVDADVEGDAEGDATVDSDLDGDAEAPPDAEPDGDAEGDAEAPAPCPAGWAETYEVPREIRLGVGFAGLFPECASAARFAVVASGMTARVELSGLPAGTAVSVISPTGLILASSYAVSGETELSFSPEQSGEVRLLLQRPQGRDLSEFSGRLSCLSGCDLEATRYPIVLVHGLAGTDSYFGLFDYFFEVVPLLTGQGYRVFTPVTEPIGHSEDRAPLLAEEVDAILAETGASKLHFLGHSQGGLDIRVLLTGLGYEDWAATVTTIATPHRGIRIEIPEFLAGMDFSEDYITGEFEALYPSPTTIPLYSWAGRTCGALEFGCQDELDGEIVSAMFAVTYRLIQAAHADDAYEGANDGLVPVASASWGELLGIIPGDHIDEIGQVAGATQGPFDHLEYFLAEARRLRDVEIVEGL